MRYIKKDINTLKSEFVKERDASNLDPASLRNSDISSKKARSLFDNDVKKLPHYKDFVHLLIKEQGYTCCYCGCRIPLYSNPQYVMEHIYPISNHKYSYRIADYFNLIISCDGGMNEKPNKNIGVTRSNKLHCDKSKGCDIIPISPVFSDVESHFRYNADGTVSAANGLDAEKKTIKILNLSDSPLLKKKRETAIISAVFSGNDILPNEDLEKLLSFYENKDDEGKYQPYSFAVANFIHQIIGH